MKAIPFLSLDAADDGIISPFSGDASSSSGGYEETVAGALLIYAIGDFTVGFPVRDVGEDVCFDPVADGGAEATVRGFVIGGGAACVPGWFCPGEGAAEAVGGHVGVVFGRRVRVVEKIETVGDKVCIIDL